MAEEIAFENGRISYFEGLVTLTLTLDRVIPHTIVHHSSTSTYMPNVSRNIVTCRICLRKTFEKTCIRRIINLEWSSELAF